MLHEAAVEFAYGRITWDALFQGGNPSEDEISTVVKEVMCVAALDKKCEHTLRHVVERCGDGDRKRALWFIGYYINTESHLKRLLLSKPLHDLICEALEIRDKYRNYHELH